MNEVVNDLTRQIADLCDERDRYCRARMRQADEAVSRARERQRGAEQQASRAIARLANVVETVRAEADHWRKQGMTDCATALLQAAARLQKMELP